jgi:hypothetical protein
MSERVFEYYNMQMLRKNRGYCGPITLHEIDHILRAAPIPSLDEIKDISRSVGVREEKPGFMVSKHFLEDIEIYANYLWLAVTKVALIPSFIDLIEVPPWQSHLVEIVNGDVEVSTPALQVLRLENKRGLHVETHYNDYHFQGNISSLLKEGYQIGMTLSIAQIQA